MIKLSAPVTASNPLTFRLTVPDPPKQGLLSQSIFGTAALATDLNGNLVWLGPSEVTCITRPVTGGAVLGIGEDGTLRPSQQFIREFDLAQRYRRGNQCGSS